MKSMQWWSCNVNKMWNVGLIVITTLVAQVFCQTDKKSTLEMARRTLDWRELDD